jgi:hypothetical protein
MHFEGATPKKKESRERKGQGSRSRRRPGSRKVRQLKGRRAAIGPVKPGVWPPGVLLDRATWV